MTMLDQMRQHKNWLKWSLGLVILTFVVLYVPQFLRQQAVGAAPDDVLATVNGRRVTSGTYQRIYNQQLAQMRSAYGELNDQMIKQLGIGPRIVQQLIDQEAVLAEADRLGITVSDGELRERLLRYPAFQENGQFIGEARYRQMLDGARPPIKPAEFEDELRRTLTAEKLDTALGGWIRVTDAEVEQEYRKRNEKVKVELAAFTANQFRSGIVPTDAEIAAKFAASPDSYKIPEKRRVRYLSIDAEALRAKMTVTPAEVEQRYRDNAATYSTPEQVRASHILLKTEGKDEAAVKKVAESVLAKVKAGGDFAALAKQYSEDDASKVNGGDLDYFGRGAMVKEFDEAAFALKPGETSGLVKSQFGFHIIKVIDKRAAATRTLADVRTEIENQIRYEKAQAEASRVADEVAAKVSKPADLDAVAKERGLSVGDSGFFARDEPLAGLGFAPSVTAEAFTLEQGKVSGVLRTNQGYAIVALTETKPSYVPKVEEVRDKVKDDVIRAKAVELARAKAETMAQAAKTNFAAAAKAAGVDVKTTDFISRGSALPEVGVSDRVDSALFALKTGETTAPIATDNAVVVARVKERQEIDAAAMTAARDQLRAELLQQRRNTFFAAYMTKAKAKMTVTYNQAALQTIIGG